MGKEPIKDCHKKQILRLISDLRIYESQKAQLGLALRQCTSTDSGPALETLATLKTRLRLVSRRISQTLGQIFSLLNRI